VIVGSAPQSEAMLAASITVGTFEPGQVAAP